MVNEIYLDNAATTRMHDEVLSTVVNVEGNFFHNSSAQYGGSIKVADQIDKARQIILSKLTREKSGDLIFTSGATESNNIVIFGKITSPRHHMIVLAGEHSSSYAPSVYLRNSDYEVDYIPLKKDGTANLDVLQRLIKKNTTLVVFSIVNSDTGVIQPSREIVDIVKRVNPRTHIHCDAVQGFCKFDFDVAQLGFDSVAISAHKVYGPKGIGALWVRKGVNLKPIMYGGAQQDYRPGTENNAGIIGFAKAVEVFDTQSSFNHISRLYKRLVDGLPNGCTLSIEYGGDKATQINPYIVNIMLPNVYGQTVMNALSAKGIFVGMGSACAKVASKNRTLIAMGILENKTKNVLRISFGIYNTERDTDMFLRELEKILMELM